MRVVLPIITLAIPFVSSSFLGLTNTVAIVHGNFTPSSTYLAPFAPEDAVDQPFQLVDDHEDLFTNHKGQLVSLKKRSEDCEKYHKGTSVMKKLPDLSY